MSSGSPMFWIQQSQTIITLNCFHPLFLCLSCWRWAGYRRLFLNLQSLMIKKYTYSGENEILARIMHT